MTGGRGVPISFGFHGGTVNFFDPEQIRGAVARAEARAQARFGAFVRRRMRGSLKYAKGKGPPGRPPHVHRTRGFTRPKKDKKTGATVRQATSPLRELIFFARDPKTDSVVIGPAKFGGKGGVAPGLLERGGRGTYRDARTGAPRAGVYAPRPFVEPAGRAEAAKFPELLKNAVR